MTGNTETVPAQPEERFAARRELGGIHKVEHDEGGPHSTFGAEGWTCGTASQRTDEGTSWIQGRGCTVPGEMSSPRVR